MNPIRAARKASGLSRRRLSELTGIHDRQLSDYERGRYRPTGERLEKLAQVLNVEPRTIGSLFRSSPKRAHRTYREISAEIREKEILQLEGLARNIIRWHSAAVRASGIDREDLLQDLMVGAIMAVDAFDPDISSNLDGYAYRTMTFRLYRSVRSSTVKGLADVPSGVNPIICSYDALMDAGVQIAG